MRRTSDSAARTSVTKSRSRKFAFRRSRKSTDEFAQSSGGWETIDQMREAIAADIRKHRELEAKRLKQGQIGEILLAAHEMEVPETLVDEELGKSLQNYARFLALARREPRRGSD